MKQAFAQAEKVEGRHSFLEHVARKAKKQE
jgi:hypothetical protein